VTAREKIDTAVDDLLGRGVAWQTAAPPHYRLLWWMGLHIPPPAFQSFLGVFAVNCVVFTLGFAAMAGIAERHHAPLELMLTFGPIAGVTIGLIVAVVYRFIAWRFGVPRWADYNPHREDETEDSDDAGW
jgi:hypothetical protein